MAYEQKISRAKPGLIGLILDDSGSMADNLLGTSDPKYKWVERYFGIILDELMARSCDIKGTEALIKARYYLYALKYGSDTELWGEGEMDIEAALKLFSSSGNSLGLGGHLEGTDAKKAMGKMYEHLKQTLAGERFKNSYPPLILHLTDGESWTDATDEAEQIRQLTTNDGNVLIASAYIGTQSSLSYTGPEDFPGYINLSEAGPEEHNVRLFNMSSETPESIRENLKADNIFPQLRPGSRLFFDVRTKEMLKHVIQVVSSMESKMTR